MSVVLTLRTDKPEAEVGVYDMQGKQLSYHTWLAHRQLSSTLLGVIRDELVKRGAAFDAIGSVLVFRGPGSFTGLRIGITVANTLAHGLNVPIVGIADQHDWLERGLAKLADGANDQLVLPEYGAEANITKQKR
jgi:tRNA threonylcarbamoyl adenosine modification protein YeaZ